MTQQLELSPPPKPNVNVVWLEMLLRGDTGWLTAKEITALSGARVHDREIRELASASEWIISGQRGYKHIEHATAEEIHHAAAWLESQAKKMAERAGLIRRNGHRRIG